MSDNGVFIGTDPSQLARYESMMGSQANTIAVHTGQASWSDWTSSIGWAAGVYGPLARPMTWSIPMFANGGNLADAAAGAYDQHYIEAATKLADTPTVDGKIIVRVGEEFNGSWMPWSAIGHEQDFVQAFHHFVDAFRSVSGKFVFEWNVNVGDVGMNPANAYPGDAYVDIVGMDFYYNTQWDSKDASAAWDSMVTRKYGLQWLEDFASAHGKPSAYSEWGITGNDNAGAYIQKAAQWFASHNVAYANYWDSGIYAITAGSGTAQGLKAAFGGGVAEPVTTTTFSSSVSQMDSQIGTDGADTLTGGAGSNYLRGGLGADLIKGGVGFNDINGNQGADTIIGKSLVGDWLVGGQGDDSITATGGAANILYGNMGQDTLIGGAGSDTLRGGQGDDSISGGGGDDWISGDRGSDTMSGGAGADSFHLFAGAGTDLVTDFNAREGDRVVVDPSVTFTVKQVGADTVVFLQGGDEMHLQNVQLASLPSGWILSG